MDTTMKGNQKLFLIMFSVFSFLGFAGASNLSMECFYD